MGKEWIIPIRRKSLVRPIADVLDAPYWSPKINVEWFPIVWGLLDILLYKHLWAGDDEEVLLALDQVRKLMAFCDFPCTTGLHFRKIEAQLSGGNLQYRALDECAPLPYVEIRPDGHLWFGQPGEVGMPTDWYDLGQVVGANGANGADGANGQNGLTYIPTVYADTVPRQSDGRYPVYVRWDRSDGGQVLDPQTPDLLGATGYTFIPVVYQGEAQRQDGQFPVLVKWVRNDNGQTIDPGTPDILGPSGLAGAAGVDGADGGTPIPVLVEIDGATVRMRIHWDNQPNPYDPNDPTTYLEYQQNLRGPEGIQGLAGESGVAAYKQPVDGEWLEWSYICYAMCRATAQLVREYYTGIGGGWNRFKAWLLEIPEFPQSVIDALGGLDLSQEAVQLAMANDQVWEDAAAEMYCGLMPRRALTNTDINLWAQEGQPGPTYWQYLFTIGEYAQMLVHMIKVAADADKTGFRHAVAYLRTASHVNTDFPDFTALTCTPNTGEWNAVFDFTDNNTWLWSSFMNNTLQSGVGWLSNTSRGYGHEVGLTLDLGAIYTINMVEIIFDNYNNVTGQTWQLHATGGFDVNANENCALGMAIVDTHNFNAQGGLSTGSLDFVLGDHNCTEALVLKRISLSGSGPRPPFAQ